MWINFISKPALALAAFRADCNFTVESLASNFSCKDVFLVSFC